MLEVALLFKYFKFNISGETAFDLSVDIDHTLLKRMQVGTHEHAHIPQAPPSLQFASRSSSSADQFTTLMDKMNSIELNSFSLSKRILANQVKFQNDLSYVCSTVRYLQ